MRGLQSLRGLFLGVEVWVFRFGMKEKKGMMEMSGRE